MQGIHHSAHLSGIHLMIFLIPTMQPVTKVLIDRPILIQQLCCFLLTRVLDIVYCNHLSIISNSTCEIFRDKTFDSVK